MSIISAHTLELFNEQLTAVNSLLSSAIVYNFFHPNLLNSTLKTDGSKASLGSIWKNILYAFLSSSSGVEESLDTCHKYMQAGSYKKIETIAIN